MKTKSCALAVLILIKSNNMMTGISFIIPLTLIKKPSKRSNTVLNLSIRDEAIIFSAFSFSGF
ncbi:MAG: hypothetical protein ACREOW_04970 [Thermodesulfobacteriota bacterium]